MTFHSKLHEEHCCTSSLQRCCKVLGTKNKMDDTLQSALHRPAIFQHHTSCLPSYNLAPVSWTPLQWSVYRSDDAVRCLNDATQGQLRDRLQGVPKTHLASKFTHVALPHNRAMDTGRGSGRLPTRLSSLCMTASCSKLLSHL